jgi:hypothetical protein
MGKTEQRGNGNIFLDIYKFFRGVLGLVNTNIRYTIF